MSEKVFTAYFHVGYPLKHQENAYLGLELNENKKEVNTMLTRSLISVINDINLLPIECDEDIKKQVELFKEVAIVNNTIKTY